MTLQLVSIGVLALLAVGLAVRGRTGAHVAAMSAAVGLDLALLLYIEATRHAVERVAGSVSPFIWVHASLSLVVVAAYATQTASGWRRLAGKPFSRRMHVAVGLTLLGLRVANFVTGLGMAQAVKAEQAGGKPALRGPVAVASKF
jgi:hypothetical protein